MIYYKVFSKSSVCHFFANKDLAEQFAEEKNGNLETHEEPFLKVNTCTQWVWVHREGFETLGELHDCRHVYQSTAFGIPDDKVSKIAFENEQKKRFVAENDYYSQSWV